MLDINHSIISDNISSEDYEAITAIHHGQQTFIAVYTSLLFIVGIPGNLLTLMVLRGQSFKGKFLPTLLVFETVLDITDLVINMSVYWVSAVFGFDIRTAEHSALCSYYLWWFYTNHMWINWTLLFLNATRLLYLKYPKFAIERCSKRSAILLECLTFVVLGIINVVGYTMLDDDHEQGDHGDAHSECRRENEILAVYHSAMLFYIPFPIMVAVCVFIVKTYREIYERLKQHPTPCPTSCSSKDDVATTTYFNDKKNAGYHQVKLTIITTVQFGATIGPYAVYFHLVHCWFEDTSAGSLRDAYRHLVYVVLLMIVYTQYAVNFFIYYVIGHRFRQEVRHIRRRWTRRMYRLMGRSKVFPSASSVMNTHTGTTDEEGLIIELCKRQMLLHLMAPSGRDILHAVKADNRQRGSIFERRGTKTIQVEETSRSKIETSLLTPSPQTIEEEEEEGSEKHRTSSVWTAKIERARAATMTSISSVLGRVPNLIRAQAGNFSSASSAVQVVPNLEYNNTKINDEATPSPPPGSSDMSSTSTVEPSVHTQGEGSPTESTAESTVD